MKHGMDGQLSRCLRVLLFLCQGVALQVQTGGPAVHRGQTCNHGDCAVSAHLI